ncbi:low molecular weight phosphotyrosine protein phosphatase [Monosporozyma unispora]|nr:hypothetical protein C6P44_001775 [Kazachstania unispora]
MSSRSESKKVSVAFICLGNYCRSPMAEAVFTQKVSEYGLEKIFNKIDSFGTCNFHTGEQPDSRALSICRKYNVPINHFGQTIKEHHFDEFDFIIGMDNNNLRDLRRICPNKDNWHKIRLFGDWNLTKKVKRIIEDPWCGDIDDFEYNYIQLEYFSEQFLEQEILLTK